MNTILDLQGASGATYRFRLWARGSAHPPMAGNYALVRVENERAAVIGVGESLDLSRVADEIPAKLRATEPLIYTRLNVSRAIREAEHADLVAQHGPVRAPVARSAKSAR